MRRLGTAMAIAPSALILLTACSDDGGGGGGGIAGGIGGDWSVESALSELPQATGDAYTVVRTADLERAAELGDLQPPADDESAWFQGMMEDPIYVPFPASVVTFEVSSDEMEEAIGFDIFEVASFAAVQAFGDNAGSIEVFSPADGDSPDSVADRVGSFDVRSWDGRVALSSDSAILDDWEDGDATLADHEALGSLAEALDEHDVYAAMLNDFGDDGAFSYSAVGIGQAVEDGEEVEYVAYVVDDADEAAGEVEEAWQDSTVSEEVSVVDVTTEGDDVVVVQVEPLQDPFPAVRLLEAGAEPFQF
jgi:hypothetical protein